MTRGPQRPFWGRTGEMEEDELVLALAWYNGVIEDGETLAPVSEHQMTRLLAKLLSDALGRRKVEMTPEQLYSAMDAQATRLIPRPPHIPIDHPDVGRIYTIEEAR